MQRWLYPLLLLLLLAACNGDTFIPPEAGEAVEQAADYPPMPEGLVEAEVERVVDGDTVVLWLDGQRERLRLIGLNSPESADPRRPVECFGVEASNKAKALLSGQLVLLESDPTQGERDPHARLLGYLWLEDGRLVNLEMIAQGYAYEYTYNAPYRYQTLFQDAEETARTELRGLWAPESCNGQRDPAEASCDPAYPDICLPSPPPDLDCRDIPHRNFRVLPPDPHNFDGGQDGIGCEGP